MKFKKTLLAFCLIMCIFFCVSSVVAGDVNETVTANEDEQQTIQETNEEIDINNGERLLSTNDNVVEQISQNDNDILSYSVQVSSYSDLVNKIEQAKTTNYANYTINLEVLENVTVNVLGSEEKSGYKYRKQYDQRREAS